LRKQVFDFLQFN